MKRKFKKFGFGDYYYTTTDPNQRGIPQFSMRGINPEGQKDLQNFQGKSTGGGSQGSWFNSESGRAIGTTINTGLTAINNSGTDYRNDSTKQGDQTGEAIASAIGPWWGALAKVGTGASRAIIGTGSDSSKNGVGTIVNPFNQFENNRNSRDVALSFINPIASGLEKGQRRQKEYQNQQNQQLVGLQQQGQKVLANYPTNGYGKYGMSFAKGGEIGSVNPNQADNDLLFKNWYTNNTLEGQHGVPYSDKLDYDYYSFFKNKGQGNIEDHFPDTYKRPNHKTFSNESIYSTPENPGGQWNGEKFSKKANFIYANGGALPIPTDNSDANQIASNMAEYKGATHEQGGIDLDTDHDGQQNIEVENNEVIKDNKVLSDRLFPSSAALDHVKKLGVKIQTNDTYASIASRLGKKKGDYESKLNSTRIGEKNTAQIMSQRLDSAVDILFQDQQVQNGDSMGNEQYKNGGIHIDPSHKGRFTEYLNRTGSTLEQALHSNNPHIRQMANFARNAKSWKHAEGGFINNYGIYPGFNKHPFIYAEGGELGEGGKETVGQKRGHGTIYTEKVKGEGITPLVNVEDTDPVIYDKNKFNNFYLNKAIKVMNPDDQGIYNDMYKQNPANAQAFVASRGGIPDFQRYLEAVRESEKHAPTTNIQQLANDSNQINTNYQPSGYRYSQGLPDTESITKRKFGPGGKFGDYFNDNAGDIYNILGTAINQSQIGKLETNFTPETSPNVPYSYQDRVPFLRNEINSQFRTASQGLNQSSESGNSALKANLYAKSLESLNGAYDSELQRKNNFDAYYNQLMSNNNQFNTQTKNYGKQLSMDNRNQKTALTQANLDNSIRGFMGNKSQKDLQDLDFDKNYINALASGNTGVAQRLLKLPEKLRKRRFGNYNLKD